MKSLQLVTSILVWLLAMVASPLRAQQEVLTFEDTLRGTITPERAWWDVGYYHLQVSVDPNKQKLNGSVQIIYKIIGVGDKLQIDLQPPLQIDSIIRRGENLAFTKKGRNAYFVGVPSLEEHAVDSVDVYYSGTPIIAQDPPWEPGFQFEKDKVGNFFLATTCQSLGASAWWPNKDHSYDEPDSMMISVTVPRPLMDVSNGRLRKIIENADSTRTFQWVVTNPINNYGVNLNAATYSHFSDTLHGEKGILDLDFYVLPYNLDKAKHQFQQAKEMLRAFEYWFGPYPFYEDGYKLVEVPYLGMEHQSSVTYGNNFKNGYLGSDLSRTGWGLKWDFIIIHESGHEWFANNITYRDIADMWIHESFTNYSETLFTEYYYGKEAGNDYNAGTRVDIKNDIPIIGIYNVNKRGSGDMYPKGGNMIHTIRHSMNNDEKFRAVLRGLNETFYHKTVTTQEIESFISSKAGIDFSKVFDQYLRTVKIPRLEYRREGRKWYYRWANTVEGFDLRLNLDPGQRIQTLSPTTEWTGITLKRGENLIDKKFLERMYYISVSEVR